MRDEEREELEKLGFAYEPADEGLTSIQFIPEEQAKVLKDKLGKEQSDSDSTAP